MPQIKLSIATNYVPGWGIPEAARELFQNMWDKQAVDPENTASVKYDAETQQLILSNKKSVLERKTLLMGSTTKLADDRTIGQFGEGYKLALLVFTRMKRPVTIFNYGAKETWTSKIVHRRDLGADVLAVDIKKHIFIDVPDNNLTFVVDGITAEDWEKIKTSNLHLREVGETIVTNRGRILLDEKENGNIYVSGLFISHVKGLENGYDFLPKNIVLGRDRSMIKEFDIKWECAQFWQCARAAETRLAGMIEKGAPDVDFYCSIGAQNPAAENIVVSNFQAQHGLSAWPVNNEVESKQARSSGLKPVVVNEVQKQVILRNENFKTSGPILKVAKPEDYLIRFFDQYSPELDGLPQEFQFAMKELIEHSRNWMVKDGF